MLLGAKYHRRLACVLLYCEAQLKPQKKEDFTQKTAKITKKWFRIELSITCDMFSKHLCDLCGLLYRFSSALFDAKSTHL